MSQAAIDVTSAASAASAADDGRTLARSPALGQFRKSPFRVLRLPPSATAKQAVWQSDKALARARVGMALPDPDPVPWLPGTDEIEIQEAAQTMESPLARMVEQLLWFDPDADPNAVWLVAALTAQDGARVQAYLDMPAQSPAMKMNQANLQLLLGASARYGVGPLALRAQAAAVAPLTWQSRGGLSLVEDPHRTVQPAQALDAHAWSAVLGAGVSAWGELLASSAFADVARAKIAALGDELLTADDLETVLSGVRTRIADLVVGETKLAIADGRLDLVSRFSAIAGRSGIDAETWLVAFRPLKAQFESELADLGPDAETGLGTVEDVSAYLDRLATLAARWRPLDEAQLLGLGALLDSALADAFGRLRGADREAQQTPRFGEVLDRVGAMAQSPSIRERIHGYRDRLADVAKSRCHFCGVRELDPEWCAAISSSREISRQRYGNQIRVQYRVGGMPIPRCEQCAHRHDFIRYAGWMTFASLATATILFALVHPASWLSSISTGAGAVLVLVALGASIGLMYFGRDIAAGIVTPRGNRRYSDYTTSHALDVLRKDGFYNFRYDFRPNAWQLINKHGVKHRGGAGASAGSLIYIGLLVLFLSLKVCTIH